MSDKGKIFVSYASDRHAAAEPIALALRSRGYDVFFDRDDLPAGQTYHDQIAAAIDASDIMVFLISPESVDKGRYTVTEIGIARKKWRTPKGRVLPIMIAPTPIDDIPAYLREVSFFETDGNLVADAALEVDHLFDDIHTKGARKTRRTVARFALAAIAASGLAAAAIFGAPQLSSMLSGNPEVAALDGLRVARTPRLGAQIIQNGEATPLYEQGDDTEAIGRVGVVLDRAPFEVRLPTSAWTALGISEPTLQVALLDEPSLFEQIVLDGDRSETPFLMAGTGVADNEFGSGTVWSTHLEYDDCCASHNYLIGNRFNASGTDYRGFLISNLHHRLTEQNMIDTHPKAYLVLYLNQDGTAAWDAPDPVRYVELEGLEITFRD